MSDQAGVAGPLIGPRHTLAATWALFVGFGLLMVGNGLQGSLVGVRAALEGFGTMTTGVVMAAYFAGFLVGSGLASRALSTVGHIRVFAGLASVASSTALVHALSVTPLSWLLMRFVTGLCMAGLYVVVESWLNDLATNETRGRILAVYMVVSMSGIGLGNGLLGTADPANFHLFVVASLLVSLSLVPVALSATSTPPAVAPFHPMPIRELLAVVPTGVIVALLVGAAQGTMLGLAPVYATRAGLDTAHIAVFIGAPIAGCVIMQFPIGLISDRISRRVVIFAAAAIAGATAALLTVVDAAGNPAIVLMLVLGGFSFPLYSLAGAYTNDWIPPHRRIGAGTSMVMVNGVGAVLGPLAAATLMSMFGDEQFFVVLAVTHGLIVAYVAYRMLVREALPVDRQGDWLPLPARASALASALLARPNRPGRRR